MNNSITFQKELIGVQDDLLRFAYKLTSDHEEANDLLQETSLKALDNEDKYAPDTNFKGWMYTIMRNIFINNYRKVVRDQTFVDQTENLYHLNLPQESGFECTESAYDLKEMHRIVNVLERIGADLELLPVCPFHSLKLIRTNFTTHTNHLLLTLYFLI